MLLDRVNIVDKVTIKEIRILSEKTQGEFSKDVEIPYSTYLKKENGKSRFLASELNRVSIKFNVPMDKISV